MCKAFKMVLKFDERSKLFSIETQTDEISDKQFICNDKKL